MTKQRNELLYFSFKVNQANLVGEENYEALYAVQYDNFQLQ